MRTMQLLEDGFGRVQEVVRQVAEGVSSEDLARRVDPGANPLGWLLWHLARVQDAQVAEVAGTTEVWTSGGWAEQIAPPYAASDTGYGHTSEQVGQLRVPAADLLTGYLDDVTLATVTYLRGLADEDLDRVVDDSYRPAVTLGVRLVSVLADDLQHAGQAAYLKGLLERQRAARAAHVKGLLGRG